MNAVVKLSGSAATPSRAAILDSLANQWEAAKAAEVEANKQRLAVEARIIELINDGSIEGTQTADLGAVKIKVTRSLTRKVDLEVLSEIADQIPEAIRNRLLKTKIELDTRELRFIESNEPELYLIVAKAVTTTPSKPAVKVER